MKTVPALFAAIVSAALTASAMGQYAIGDGTGLDNNLQVGGGSTNPAQVNNYINSGNNVTTGNVQGLNRLSGRSPYRAPGEFSGDLPSNSLFRFNATSLPNSLGRPLSLGTQPVYRSGSGVSAADVLTNNITTRRAAGAFRVDNALNPDQRRTTPGDYTRPRQQMGVPTVPDGRNLELNASPLMGIRAGDLSGPAAKPDASRDNPTINGVPVEVGQDGRLLAPLPGADADAPDAEIEGGPIDRQLSFQIDDRPLGADPESLEQQIQTLEERLNTANATDGFNAGRGSDVYMTLLKQVQDNREKTASQALENSLAGEQMFADDKDVTGAERKPGALDAFRKKMLDRARVREGLAPLERDNDNDRMRDRLDEGWQVPGVPALPGEKPDNNQQDLDRLPEGLTEMLDYDLPAISTLASNTKDKVNQLLRKAEKDLLDQRYYDAEDRYRTVLDLKPGHPMARVGQLHAQLGVGMVYTAGQNMRNLFLQHPELIAAKYDQRLLPAAVRLQWVREELKGMLDRDKKIAEPALLLAYLAYQFDEKEAMKAALDEALRRQPEKAIVQLLRRIWLRNQSASVGDAQPRTFSTQ